MSFNGPVIASAVVDRNVYKYSKIFLVRMKYKVL